MTTRIDPQIEGMFTIEVDEMCWNDLNNAHDDWPGADRVRNLRLQVSAQGQSGHYQGTALRR
ncbi:MAG TPA: hypothetical protein ENN02_03135 [Halothiobacillus sp.]|nr:hypothetical protein [Halothiobacillus sp.]